MAACVNDAVVVVNLRLNNEQHDRRANADLLFGGATRRIDHRLGSTCTFYCDGNYVSTHILGAYIIR